MFEVAVAVCDSCFAQAAAQQTGLQRPAFVAMLGGQDFDPVPADGRLARSVARLQEAGQLLAFRRGVAFGELFPELDAVIVQGGLGVTSEALVAGVPTIVSGILLLDQRFWAAQIADLGCGPPGLCIDDLLAPQGGRPRVVNLVERALSGGEPGGAVLGRTWRGAAARLQAALLADRKTGPCGIGVNAKAVHKAGLDAWPLRQVYVQDHGVRTSVCRQVRCCGRAWSSAAVWLVCRFLPRMLDILVLVATCWHFGRPCRRAAAAAQKQGDLPELGVQLTCVDSRTSGLTSESRCATAKACVP